MISAIFDPFGPSQTGMPSIARLPRLDRHPGMHLAVIEFDLALVVDDQAGIERVAMGIELHDGEAAPDVIGHAGAAEVLDLGAVDPAHDRRIGVHRQAVQRVFGENDQIHGRHVAPGLADQLANATGLAREILGRGHDRVLDLHQSDDDTVGCLVQSAQSAHGFLRRLIFRRRSKPRASVFTACYLSASAPASLRKSVDGGLGGHRQQA